MRDGRRGAQRDRAPEHGDALAEPADEGVRHAQVTEQRGVLGRRREEALHGRHGPREVAGAHGLPGELGETRERGETAPCPSGRGRARSRRGPAAMLALLAAAAGTRIVAPRLRHRDGRLVARCVRAIAVEHVAPCFSLRRSPGEHDVRDEEGCPCSSPVGCLLGCAPKDKVPEEAVHPDAAAGEGGADAEGDVGPAHDGSVDDVTESGEPSGDDGAIPEGTTFDGPAGQGEPCNPALDSCQLPLKCCPGNPLGPDGGPTYSCLQPLGLPAHCPPI